MLSRASSKVSNGSTVSPRRAARHRGDPDVRQGHPVVASDAGRPICETGPVQCGVEEVARGVPGEHAAGAVRAVRAGREADEQHARRRVAEPRHRSAPVGVASVRAALGAGDGLAVLEQPRAAAAAGQGRRVGVEAGWRLHDGAMVPGRGRVLGRARVGARWSPSRGAGWWDRASPRNLDRHRRDRRRGLHRPPYPSTACR